MKITLLGKARGWMQAGRHNCLPGEVWGLNVHCLMRPYDKIFEIHDRANTGASHTPKEILEIIETVNRRNIPFITLDPKEWPEIPSAVAFPLKEMPYLYFTSSFDYMIAYAIWYGATEIQMFGCKVIAGGSHEFARPNIEFWLGYAIAKGIKITIHPPSDLLKLRNDKLYGYNIFPEQLPL